MQLTSASDLIIYNFCPVAEQFVFIVLSNRKRSLKAKPI